MNGDKDSSPLHGQGEDTRHIPVLGGAAVEALAPKPGGVYVDATFGAGGYTRLLLATPETRVIGIDRDPTAIMGGMGLVDAAAGRLTLIEARISELASLIVEPADGIVFDLGVSSMQLDTAERGFSFRLDGPLDMRMGRSGPSAADVVAQASDRALAAIIAILGEERHARAVARAIVARRSEQPFETTRDLANVVGRVVRSRPGEIHPATRTFQGLRIFVNDELGEISQALAAAEHCLKPGGRLAVVSFHSLEDRIVKQFLVDRSRVGGGSRHMPERVVPASSFAVLTRKPVVATETEVHRNPRARSAKLRVAERTDAPAHPDRENVDPRLPRLDEFMVTR